jgi:hypothetical protein
MRLVVDTLPATAEQYVLPHEPMVGALRQHPARILPALAMAVGGVLAAAGVTTVAQGVPTAMPVVWVLAGFLLLRAILDVWDWSTQLIVLTQHRLILISRSKATTIPLPAVQDLAFTRSGGSGQMGYGALIFEANGRASAVIDYIPCPEQFYMVIYCLLYPPEASGSGDGDGGGTPGRFELAFDSCAWCWPGQALLHRRRERGGKTAPDRR